MPTPDVDAKPRKSNKHPLYAHRIAAAANGWSQIPTWRKAGCFGWPKLANDREAIDTLDEWRSRKLSGTGIRIEKPVCSYDMDVTIDYIGDEILCDLHDLDPAAYRDAIWRSSGANTMALFFRARVPFKHVKTHSYTAHPEHIPTLVAAYAMPTKTVDERKAKGLALMAVMQLLDPQKVEMYGGIGVRQFVYEGEHSDGRFYICLNDRGPWNTRLDEVAYLPAEFDAEHKHGGLIDRADAILAKHLTRIPMRQRSKEPVLYDLTPDYLFFPKGQPPQTIAELTSGMERTARGGIRGCIEDSIDSKSQANCILYVTLNGRVAITDFSNDNQMHYMVEDAPTTLDTEALAAALRAIGAEEAKGAEPPPAGLPEGLRHTDLVAHALSSKFIYRPTGEEWPAITVDKRLGKVITGYDKEKEADILMPSSTFIMKTNVVEQKTWMPGSPEIIEGIVMLAGGIQPKSGARVYNLYRPPIIKPGDPTKAGRWLDHVRMVYGDEPGVAEHIICFMACAIQFPGVKINHMMLLGGAPGIGKDTILVPLRYGVGAWNFAEIRPSQLKGDFNGWQQAVVLRINEMHDLGALTMFQLYECLKPVGASPPETLPVNRKFMDEYYIPNVVKGIGTTNYLQNGVYLPPEDRRTFVAWSKLEANEPGEDYFNGLHSWLEAEGNCHVVAHLRALDLSNFDPKAPPLKTDAFWSIVNASRSPTDAGISDVIETLATIDPASPEEKTPPPILTSLDLQVRALEVNRTDVFDWLTDVKHRRQIPSSLERLGYVEVPNHNATDRRWKIHNRSQMVYRKNEVDYNKAVALIAVRQSGELDPKYAAILEKYRQTVKK